MLSLSSKRPAFFILGMLLFCRLNLPGAATNEVAAELQNLVTKIQAKLKTGEKTEKELADDIKAFDELLAKHKAEKTEETASILYMKSKLYLEALDDADKAIACLEQLKRDFPETRLAKNADKMIESVKVQVEAEKLQGTLVAGAKFPDFNEKDVAGKALSVGNYKSKVVLLDFWATWCRPCLAELPNVIKAYEKYHEKGFEIIGISLDTEESKLTAFTKQQKMPWQQFFDGNGWQNKLAVKYGVRSIPATFLIDGEGKILGKNLRGEDLEKAIDTALKKK